MSRKVLAGLAVVAASGTAAVAPASAHTTVFPTTIHVTQAATTPVGGGFQVEVNGYLTSPTSKCRKSRTVKLYLIAGGTTTLKDVDLSSLRGEFGGRRKCLLVGEQYFELALAGCWGLTVRHLLPPMDCEEFIGRWGQ